MQNMFCDLGSKKTSEGIRWPERQAETSKFLTIGHCTLKDYGFAGAPSLSHYNHPAYNTNASSLTEIKTVRSTTGARDIKEPWSTDTFKYIDHTYQKQPRNIILYIYLHIYIDIYIYILYLYFYISQTFVSHNEAVRHPQGRCPNSLSIALLEATREPERNVVLMGL